MNILIRIASEPKRYLAKLLLSLPIRLPDKCYLKLLYLYTFGCQLNFNSPKTFSEKLQWLKLYDRRPVYTKLVDKYAVKQYVADKIGEQYIIPTLGLWHNVEDIDWNVLPEQFVLKTTHGGGGNGIIICKDKSKLDKRSTINQLQKSLKTDLYEEFREWPYKNVAKSIIAEQFMYEENNKNDDLTDYKFYCFNGQPTYCQVIRNRSTKETIDFYDMEWNHMPFVGLNPVANNGIIPVAKPAHLKNMIEICRKLSNDIPFARIDLYVINNKVYFGEITFYPASGMGVFTPSEWNYKLGELINLK